MQLFSFTSIRVVESGIESMRVVVHFNMNSTLTADENKELTNDSTLGIAIST